MQGVRRGTASVAAGTCVFTRSRAPLTQSQELSGAHHQLEMKQAEAFAKLRSQQDRLVEQQSDLREREKALHARETVSWVFLGLCIGAALLLVPRMLGRGSMRSITKQRTV